MVSGEGSSDALGGSEKDQTPTVPVPVTGTKGEGSGSGLLNEKRKGVVEDERGKLKMVRTDDLGASKPMLPPTKGPLFRCNSPLSDEQQQLRFSTPIPSNNGLNMNYQNAIFPSYHSSIPCARNTGVCSSNSNRNMHGGPLIAAGRPFTADQWMERNYTPGFSCLLTECSRPSSVRHPSFPRHLGQFTEQEPRRCRRTDGKRWRCRRDVVADQKYCERHLKRGHHCLRRLVEGQSSGSAISTGMVTSCLATSVSGISPSYSFTIAQQQEMTLQHAADTSSMNISRIAENTLTMGMQDQPRLSLSSSIDKRENDGFLAIRKENTFEGPTLPDLGLISSDSLPDPQSSNSIEGKNIHSSPVLSDEDSQDSQSQLVRHFIDDWPHEESDHLDITWPEVQSDRSQLSISRPMGSSEGSVSDTSMHAEANGVSVSSEVLTGEKALKNANENPQDGNSSSSVNVMTDEGCDSKLQLGSSPTDVLQNTNWGSSSNSSAESSPRDENNKTNDCI